MNNNRRLLLASFMTLIAAGAGFAIRGAILGDWESNFGFTKGDLGTITGGGLTGFGIVILVGSVIADRIGYKTVLVVAFLLHVLSAAVTLAATPVYEAYGQTETYWCLFVGMFLFAIANGLCEAVINPLVATLYPDQKTHYLNILHAGWPGGLIVGGILGYLFCGSGAVVFQLRWEIPMMFFLVPTAYYGFIVVKETFPLSETKAAGVDFGTMLKEFVAPMFLFLLVLHAMVGYVELGTDSWITNIMNNVIEGKAILLFIYTSAIMFVLRFFAGPIVERINPIGLLFLSAVFAAIGLYWLGSAGAGLAVVAAATIYGLGKTFFWPTMLGVVGERFPKGGALTMGAVGGIGMLSAGLLGGPGIGYKQDYYASQKLESVAPDTYGRYRAEDENSFLFFPAISGLDGKKVGDLDVKIKNAEEKTEAGSPLDESEKLAATDRADQGSIKEAAIFGGRMALKWTALVPVLMAVGYLLLLLYFRSKGGYQQEVLHGEQPVGEHYTGGVEGPMEG
ncbi:MAG: MFS transporter [Planctomycetaceae bacterium]|jgi:MFS family permease|nr:MFS transporter [Planctomycetaceae bacterium]MBT6157774.1 MFS transporter [Planctomycetaceae bacterium]MBT6484544.1 MFS transporter [Planctomycetaceae bacterium]MBT6493675.1 MFS transporter [Planctomycetaceae bacterium]